jgi:hypothetical protein
MVTDGAFVLRAGKKHLRSTGRRVSSCVQRTKGRSLIVG